jgi:predicted alpha/beta hydrolase family esterase
MITIILPGYSAHNKDWADDVAKKLTETGLQTKAHEWKHWQSGSFSLPNELKKIIEEIGNEKVNIIAKSVGVYVALNLIPKVTGQINKVILCGIASVANEDRKDLVKFLTEKIDVENILCIQNENDKYVKFDAAKKFYHDVEPRLKVISKPRSDHDYPFIQDFIKFLA